MLKDNERIDNLQIMKDGIELTIIQNPSYFCFGIDAVLLANLSKIHTNDKVLDLCCGNGIIPIILYGKTNASIIHGVEIQEKIADMADRSLKLNNISGKIQIFNEDLKNFKGREYDVITCNPPYKKADSGKISENKALSIARNEIACTLEDVIYAAQKMLKPHGRLYMIHRPERLSDILYLMREYKIEAKSLRFIHPNAQKPPSMVFIEGIKNANSSLNVEKPLFIYNNDGSYTHEILEIYGKNDI